MLSWFKKWWPELLVFGLIIGAYILDMSPNWTWINTNSDGVHLTYAAKYLYPAHKGSAPLYLLLGHFFQMIPIGTEFWRMALMSVIGSSGCAILVYLIIKKHLTANIRIDRYLALLGAIIFAGSALVFSQTEIVKYYTLTTMFGLLAYYMAQKGKWNWSMASLGAGFAIHPIIVFMAVPIVLFNKEMRNIKRLLILAPFALFYLYVPIVTKLNPSPNMWNNLTPGSQISDFVSTLFMLTGGLAIWDFPKRVLDTVGIMGLCLGLATIPAIVYFVKTKNWYKTQLFWLFFLPIGYFASDMSPQTYVYLYPAIAFGAIVAVIALTKMNIKWLYAVAVVAIALWAYNANYFDIGRTLDPNLTATQYMQELKSVPDNNILIAEQGWEWTAIYVFNKENNRQIIPVYAGTLQSTNYQRELEDNWGIKLTAYDIPGNLIHSQQLIVNSIIAQNKNVWMTQPTSDYKNYGVEIVTAAPVDYGSGVIIPTWQVKPNNPYDYITGALEVKDWVYLNYSNYTVALFFLLGVIGATIVMIPTRLFRRKKDEPSKVQDIHAQKSPR